MGNSTKVIAGKVQSPHASIHEGWTFFIQSHECDKVCMKYTIKYIISAHEKKTAILNQNDTLSRICRNITTSLENFLFSIDWNCTDHIQIIQIQLKIKNLPRLQHFIHENMSSWSKTNVSFVYLKDIEISSRKYIAFFLPQKYVIKQQRYNRALRTTTVWKTPTMKDITRSRSQNAI